MALELPSPSAKALARFSVAKELVKESRYRASLAGILALTIHRHAEAIAELDAVVAASSDPSAYFYLAYSLTHSRQFDRALAAWDEAIKRQPNSLACSFNRGLTLCLLERWDLAQAQLERACLLDPAGAKDALHLVRAFSHTTQMWTVTYCLVAVTCLPEV